ncbi:putative FAD-binding domain-containing protein [Seiridium cardinale]
MAERDFTVREKVLRDESSKLDVIIVGAGLGGLGAAISVLLAGHNVTVLEAASEIGEVGAGIQVLPNSAKTLFSWGLKEHLEQHATKPRKCNFIGWKGNHLSSMDYYAYAQATGAPFLDFHRANLHKCLLDRAIELGASIITKASVLDLAVSEDQLSATVTLKDGRQMEADLVVGADGINSTLREILLGHPDPPVLTGDLAYRLLLDADAMRDDEDLKSFIEDPQVNYWLGPDAHAVNYVLKGGKQFNMVLLVPDDIPPGPNTVAGNVDEMQAYFKDWDPRISKLTALCKEVQKWRLCIRPGLEPTWSHPSGSFTLLGDAVHATLPYLASGAGMALEDGGILGLCLARITDKTPASKRAALDVYEACRRERTEKVVKRGSYNQWMYHLHDGDEQRDRDVKLVEFERKDEEWLGQPGFSLPESLETGDDPFPWRYHGVARWLLTYDIDKDVETGWQNWRKRKEGSVTERANL